MAEKGKKVSPVLFGATVLCFLFPFVTVSCSGQKTATFTGVQLAIGTTVDEPQMFGPSQKKKVDPEPLATLAGVCAVVSLGLSFVGGLRAALGPAISGVAGALCLLLLKSKMDHDVVRQGQGLLQLNYEAGFSLALLLLIAGAAWNAYLFSQRRLSGTNPYMVPLSADARGHPEDVSSVPVSRTGAPAMACPTCGEAWSPDAKFCTNCGKPLSGVSA